MARLKHGKMESWKGDIVSKNIYVVGLDMDNRSPEDLGREAALKINEIVEGLITERDAKKNETTEKEGKD